jgi:hypothetical protein
MPAKSKKVDAPQADDFDDIIAQAEQINASVSSSIGNSSSSSSSDANNVRSGSINSSSGQVPPTDEEANVTLIHICIAGDLVRLRWYLQRTDRRFDARPVCHAAVCGKLDIVRCLVEEYGADINGTFDKGCTHLFCGAQYGHLALVRCMVTELGADVNKAGDDGGTPLFIAAQSGHSAVALCLVKELGADVNQANRYTLLLRWTIFFFYGALSRVWR